MQEELLEILEQFWNQIDAKKTGRLKLNEFVLNIKMAYPPVHLAELLRFEIIPARLLDEVNMQPSLSGSMLSVKLCYRRLWKLLPILSLS
jgi:hypothetical protein